MRVVPSYEQNLRQVMALEVPVVVRVGERQMSVKEVVRLVPGSIIELTKNAEAEIDLLVNGKAIGCGNAVKVGENFGIRLTYIGDMAARAAAAVDPSPPELSADDMTAAMADQLLAN